MTNWTAPEDTALIVVDPQNDFCPGGKLAVENGDEIIPVINDLIARFPKRIFTQDFHPAGHKSFASQHEGKAPFETTDMPYGIQVLWPDHCVQETNGADFRADLNITPDDLVLQKGTNPGIDSYSGFFENDGKTNPLFADGSTLTEKLHEMGIKKLVFVGLAYDFCVGWHGLDARKEGFEAIILKSACRPIAMPLEDGKTTVDQIESQLAQAGATIVHSVNDLPWALGTQQAPDNHPGCNP